MGSDQGGIGMIRNQVDKFLQKYVAVEFYESWFNEATQTWVYEDEPYIGVLVRVPYEEQSKFYMLKSEKPLATDNACWGPAIISKIREL